MTGCRKDDDFGTVDLVAVIDDSHTSNAKVYIDESYHACWQKGDEVKINGTSYPVSVDISDGYNQAKIIGVATAQYSYSAGYPADNWGDDLYDGATYATVTIPNTQIYETEHIYSDGSGESKQKIVAPMAAYCAAGSNTLLFHNVASVIKATFTNSSDVDLELHYITVTGASFNLAGTATVNNLNSTTPSMEAPSEGCKDITLDLSATHPTIGSGKDTTVYLVSAPFAAQRLTARVLAKDADYGEEGHTSKYYTLKATTTESTYSLGRNDMASVSFEIDECECVSSTGKCDYAFWGCGTEENPFIIASKDDLVTFRDIVDYVSPYNTAAYQSTYNTASRHYRQITDIILNESGWGGHNTSANLPIGIQYSSGSSYYTQPFQANYDGGGHSVKMNTSLTSTHGASIPVALFGVVGDPSGSTTNYIKNLNITGSVQGTGKVRDYAGLVGYIIGNTNIINCANKATVANNHANNAGGVVGGLCAMVGYINQQKSSSTFDGAGTVTFQNCVNYGAVSNASSKTDHATSPSGRQQFNGTGGILGDLAKGTSCTFQDCSNEGSVSTSSSQYIGGIIGVSYNDLTPTFVGINSNKGSVSATGKTCAGGIMGFSKNSFTISATLRNEGSVSGAANIGGIIGYTSSAVTINANMENTSDASVSGTSTNIGGFIGYANTAPVLSAGVSIVNNGTVSSTTGYVGGVIGFVNDACGFNGTLTNRGTVSAAYVVGGICGRCLAATVSSSATIKNFGRVESSASTSCSTSSSVNRSNVSATGGIIGLCTKFTNNGSIENGAKAVVRNTGSKHDVGGIVGLCSSLKGQTGDGSFICNASSTIVTNQDSVFGANYIGGIVGCVRGPFKIKSGASVSNSGKVRGAENVGGIAGYSYDVDSIFGTATNSGTVIASNYSGGIVGYASNSFYMSGSVSNSAPIIGSYGGGIIGEAYSTVNLAGTASNTGAISGGGKNGGIIGYGNKKFVAGNSPSNTAPVVSTGNYSGGICGWMCDTVIVSGATNSGRVTSSSYNTGGIVAYSGKYIKLTNCTNTGDSVRGTYNTGGMVGNSVVSGSALIQCKNTAIVHGTYSVGGMIGSGRCSTMKRCINTGNISADGSNTSTGLGGLMGNLGTSSILTIDSCKNEGNIDYDNSNTSVYVGGLVGYTGSQINVQNSCNRGNVTVSNKCYAVAGLVGQFRAGSSEIVNCYCSGNVKNTKGTYVGGLATIYNYNLAKVNNCYYGGTLTKGSSTNYGDMAGCYSSYKIETNTNTYTISSSKMTNRTTNLTYSSAVYQFSSTGPDYTTTNNNSTLLNALKATTPSGYSDWTQTGSAMPHLSWEDESWAQ